MLAGMSDHIEKKLWKSTELAKRWGMSSDAVLSLYHTGVMPAEISEGRTIRFDLEKCEKALAERAEKRRRGD